MPSNNSKYTEEFREQIATRILETGQSATSMAEEMGIDTTGNSTGPHLHLGVKVNGSYVNPEKGWLSIPGER